MSGLNKKQFYFLVVLVALIAFTLRLIGLGSFMTVDEEKWMLRGGDFYHKLFDQADPGGTFTTTHPGVTTQWLAGLGVYWQEKNIGQHIDTSNLNHFRLATTWPITMTIVLLIILVMLLTAKLMGYPTGLWTGLLLATEPYLVGMSQIVHVDMLLALFMLAAVLTLLIHRRENNLRWLLASGLFMGLSLATKLMPAVWLGMFTLVLFFFGSSAVKTPSVRLRQIITNTSLVFTIAIITFYFLWPALWVKTDLGHSYSHDVISVATQEHIASASSTDPIEPATFYLRALLGRVRPFVLFLAAGLLLLVIKYLVSNTLFHHLVGQLPRHDQKQGKSQITAGVIGWLSFYSLGYLLLITFAAKKADRYAMPALVTLPILAAAALVIVWPVALSKINWLQSRVVSQTVIVLLTFSLILQSLLWLPYPIAYNSDIFTAIRPLTQQGWGEGLDAAARWLNQSPVADRLMIASWYPGVIATYFHGQTMSLSSRHDHRVGYVVTYRNMRGRAPDDIATNVLDEFADQEPVHTIYINNKAYVKIYNVMGLYYYPQNSGELTGVAEVGQIITAPNHWDSISLGLSNYSGRQNNKDVILHVKTSPEADTDLRTVVVNAADISDRQWQQFTFAPIDRDGQQTYYVSLTSPESVPGNAITVMFVDRDLLPGQMLWRSRPRQAGESNKRFLRPDYDIAYRLP